MKSGAALDDIVVENMQLQADAIRRQSGRQTPGAEPAPLAVIAVAEGDGMRGVFHDLNCAIVIQGGAGKNPATEDFVAAIDGLEAEEIIILPNNGNIELAARQAADMIAGRRVTVVATRTVAEGVSAMIAYADSRDARHTADAIVEAMSAAAQATTTIEITRATRSTTLQGLNIRQDDFLAIINGRIRVAAADIESALLDALAQADGDSQELATLYYGPDLSAAAAEGIIARLSADFPNLEYELVCGGQALYPLIVSVE